MHNSQVIYAFFDTQHLIKSVRNILTKNDIKTTDGIISWKIIDQLYAIDRQGITRMCPKLTDDHVVIIKHNSFKKMRVKLATQVLSKTIASAIEICVKYKNCTSAETKKALPTSKFTRKLNNLYDVFNSQKMNSCDDFKAPINKNKTEWKTFLETMRTYLGSIEIIKNDPLEKKKNVKAFNGFIQNINAIFKMSETIFSNLDGIQYILLGRLCQDVVENLFTRLRGSGGYHCVPSGGI